MAEETRSVGGRIAWWPYQRQESRPAIHGSSAERAYSVSRPVPNRHLPTPSWVRLTVYKETLSTWTASDHAERPRKGPEGLPNDEEKLVYDPYTPFQTHSRG